jgi:hypothetical protein
MASFVGDNGSANTVSMHAINIVCLGSPHQYQVTQARPQDCGVVASSPAAPDLSMEASRRPTQHRIHCNESHGYSSDRLLL